jgi:oxygen-independent coproporphyrinogen-3 oxidase
MIAEKLHPVLSGTPYRGYVYAYPHKTAYRAILPPRSLREVWAAEPKGALFLYLHVPFCTMRCGFCNLFTTPKANDGLVALYLDALRRQAETVRHAMPAARFARLAIGGGTPTFLDASGLAAVFDIAEGIMDARPATIPTSIETSPDTLTPDKVALFAALGVERVSIGIQSFVDAETANCGRPQSSLDVHRSLALLADSTIPVLNIDLMYGLQDQSSASWHYSIRQALSYGPEEIYLYPLYVRPLTGLGRSRKNWDDERLALYREGRDLLLSEGYSQVSMRMFRRDTASSNSGPSYCCQEDGMIGLGCGARSYTRALHYSLDYAVGAKGVREIIADYVAREPADFARVERGFVLDLDEQRRRYILQSILNAEGLNVECYRESFGRDPADDFPELNTFEGLGLLALDVNRWTPTDLGLERSDALGPWLFSNRVQTLMEEYEAK